MRKSLFLRERRRGRRNRSRRNQRIKSTTKPIEKEQLFTGTTLYKQKGPVTGNGWNYQYLFPSQYLSHRTKTNTNKNIRWKYIQQWWHFFLVPPCWKKVVPQSDWKENGQVYFYLKGTVYRQSIPVQYMEEFKSNVINTFTLFSIFGHSMTFDPYVRLLNDLRSSLKMVDFEPTTNSIRST